MDRKLFCMLVKYIIIYENCSASVWKKMSYDKLGTVVWIFSWCQCWWNTCRASNEGITEEAVRRYLMRKPMTIKDLVQKFKSRNAGMTKEQMTTTIAQILKRINPQKTKINDKLYLSIKKDSWCYQYMVTNCGNGVCQCTHTHTHNCFAGRHRLRDHSIPCMPFPIGALL